MRVLLVEDEELLSTTLAKGLRKRGYAVDTAPDGAQALYDYKISDYNLIILDLNLPQIDGLEVLRRIREQDDSMRILILSARGKVEDRVAGLDLGANDYLPKPFDFNELDARLRNLLRRQFVQAPTQLKLGELVLDTARKCAFAGEADLGLPRKEYNILEHLALHKSTVVSAETIIEHVWDSEADPFSNVLQYHISMLKKKLSAFKLDHMLRNIRGQGYVLEANDHEMDA